jgi:putative hydrolase of the HAD superfamily
VTPAAVVFDFDGLILDTEWCDFTTTAAVFAAHGEELSLDLWKTYIGNIDHPHWADILEGQLGHLIDRDRWVPERRAANARCTNAMTLMPGVVNLFDALEAAAVPMAVASSSPADWVGTHLHERGLRDRFVTVCSGDEVPRTKPDPALYLLACERLGVAASRAVAIEDSIHGVRAAKAAGMVAVAVPSSMTADMDFSAADLRVHSCEALDPLVLGELIPPR